MQNIIIDKPYRFVPPYTRRWWFPFLRVYVPWHIRRAYGVERLEFEGAEHVQESMAAGHGVLLAPNHCRPSDPPTLGLIQVKLGCPVYLLASWHLFMQSRVQSWMMRRAGAFSIYREGVDRESLRVSIDLLAQADRPLVIFPEGVVSRANDRLGTLLEGVAFIARSAARHRAKVNPAHRVVVHPVFLRYSLLGDLRTLVEPALAALEKRLSWPARPELPLRLRICRIGEALLSLKEIEFLGQPQAGSVGERLGRLIERLLGPLEAEWLKGQRDSDVVERVKKLRSAIVPDMAASRVSDAERARRWQQLADCYLAQQLFCYPPDYLDGEPTAERLLETVERFEEDLTDACRIYPLRCVVRVGPAIPVSPEKDRDADARLLRQLEESLRTMLRESAALCHPYQEPPEKPR
jgi:1-acyl-sn-glycerol-3-phosphate acyltransferase